MMYLTFLSIIMLAVVFAFFARQGSFQKDARAFFAARSQFGPVLFFMLSVGETYSIGSLLGFTGGVVTNGSSVALWFIGYILLAFPIGFVLYPLLWKAGRSSGAVTLPDLFRHHYDSRLLEIFVAGLLVLLMVPLGTMQFIGLASVLKTLSPGLSILATNGLGALLAFAFVAIAGLRAAALVSLLKDGLIILTICLIAFLTFWHWGYLPTRPLAEALLSPAHTQPGIVFIVSTIIAQAVGFCIAPQTAAATFSARDPDTIRRAQVWMPLYMLFFPLLFGIAGYSLTHDLEHTRPDAILLTVAERLLPGWALGLVLGGITLTALVWLGSVSLAMAAIVTRNLLPGVSEKRQKHAGIGVIVCYLTLSLLSANFHAPLIVNLNTLFYLGLVQLFPGVLVIVLNLPVSATRTAVGVGGGVLCALFLREKAISPYECSPALIGLGLNLMIAFWGNVRFRRKV